MPPKQTAKQRAFQLYERGIARRRGSLKWRRHRAGDAWRIFPALTVAGEPLELGVLSSAVLLLAFQPFMFAGGWLAAALVLCSLAIYMLFICLAYWAAHYWAAVLMKFRFRQERASITQYLKILGRPQ